MGKLSAFLLLFTVLKLYKETYDFYGVEKPYFVVENFVPELLLVEFLTSSCLLVGFEFYLLSLEVCHLLLNLTLMSMPLLERKKLFLFRSLLIPPSISW